MIERNGRVWLFKMIGLNKVYNEDSLINMKKIDDSSVDLILADPPYNVGKDYGNGSDQQSREEYLEFTRKWMSEAYRVLKNDGTIYVFGGLEYISHMFIILEELGFVFNSWMVWHYTQGAGRTKGFSTRHDDILMFTKTKKFNFYLDEIRIPQKYYRKRNNMAGANPGNVWKLSHIHYSETERTQHPTQKPHALYLRMIMASSKKGDIVLDPFAGSGSSLFVAKKTERNYIGFEIEEEYINIINNQLLEDKKYNSYFEEILRIPNDYKNEDDILEYLEMHRDKFILKHYPELLEEFEKEILNKYGENILLLYKMSN